MLFNSYTITEVPGTMSILWSSPTLPPFLRGLCLAGLGILPFVFFFRAALSRGWARWNLRPALSPRTLGGAVPGLSLLLGGALWFSGPSRPLILWQFTSDGIYLKSDRGETRLLWKDIDSTRLDDRNPNPELAGLILRAKDGREAWLVLEWLTPLQREKVLDWVEGALPGKLPAHIPREPH